MFRQTVHVYDLIYEASGKDYAAESSDVHALVQDRRPGARTLLDVACGTGGHLRHLRRWYEVTGVDVDPGMVGEARRQVPGAVLVEADMRTLRLPASFDAVVCLFSSIGYMRSADELGAAIAGMADHLAPGGVLVVDGWIRPEAWIDGGPPQVVVATTEEMKVVRVGRSRREGDRTLLEMHHLVAGPDGIEHVVDHHELVLFPQEQYEAALRAAGLAVDVADSPMPGRDRYIGTKPP